MKSTVRTWVILGAALIGFSSGCGGPPNQANIALRRENEQLKEQVQNLRQQQLVDDRMIRQYQDQHGSLPTLPVDRLNQLFVATGLKFGRLTGGTDLNQPGSGDHGLKVAIAPIDQQGDPIKAAGTFEIQAFDLALGNDALIGDWKFDLQQSSDHWISGVLIYSYVFTCPWQTPPRHSQITLRVTFFDELTQTTLPPVEKVVNITPPTANDVPIDAAPSSGPAAQGR